MNGRGSKGSSPRIKSTNDDMYIVAHPRLTLQGFIFCERGEVLERGEGKKRQEIKTVSLSRMCGLSQSHARHLTIKHRSTSILASIAETGGAGRAGRVRGERGRRRCVSPLPAFHDSKSD